MCMVTAGTDDTADTQGAFAIWCFQGASVVSVYGEAGRMSASAGKSVQLQAANKVIIKIWC